MNTKRQQNETVNLNLALSPEEERFISELQSEKFYTKGTIILSEGEIVSQCYHVIKGCIRKYHLKDGEEKTTDFFIETDSIATRPSGIIKVTSKYFLECIEDSTLSVITAEQEDRLYKKFPRFNSLCRISTEQKLEEYQEMFSTFISSSPEERYLNLMNTRPEVLKRVPQYQIASYLGVKPESLSRIRKRLSNQNLH